MSVLLAGADRKLPTPSNLDGISSLSFSPKHNLLVASSWDSRVMCFRVNKNGSGHARSTMRHRAPVLTTAFAPNGSRVFSAGCDRTARLWDLGRDRWWPVAAHDAPIRKIAYCNDLHALATGGWDRRVRYWDCRSRGPKMTVRLPERVYAMDAKRGVLVVGLANRWVAVYDLRRPARPFEMRKLALRFQIRSISLFPDRTGFATAAVSGRVAIEYIDKKVREKKNFMFKCHRHGPNVYNVNGVEFHPYGTFATVGSDGIVAFWDKDSKQRLHLLPRRRTPISCGAFNASGSLFAYAVSYDYSKGFNGANTPQTSHNRIYVHKMRRIEIKPKPLLA